MQVMDRQRITHACFMRWLVSRQKVIPSCHRPTNVLTKILIGSVAKLIVQLYSASKATLKRWAAVSPISTEKL